MRLCLLVGVDVRLGLQQQEGGVSIYPSQDRNGEEKG